jgi:hypothetical protein
MAYRKRLRVLDSFSQPPQYLYIQETGAMWISYFMIPTYMLNCVLMGAKPCKYFQLNSEIFNDDKGIFSKIEIDQLIPEKWRLDQYYDDGVKLPRSYPVFVKPEWGQNSSGIYRADNEESFRQIQKKVKTSRIRHLVQEAAPARIEFEIFSILHHLDKDRFAELTITQALNSTEEYPINGVFNKSTRYQEITESLSATQIETLWALLGEIGRFNISRVGLRADSVEAMLAGKFHVIEINLFIPMPINMLDARYRFTDLWKQSRSYMMALARVTKTRNKALKEKPVFIKHMLYNRTSPFLNYIRNRL